MSGYLDRLFIFYEDIEMFVKICELPPVYWTLFSDIYKNSMCDIAIQQFNKQIKILNSIIRHNIQVDNIRHKF